MLHDEKLDTRIQFRCTKQDKEDCKSMADRYGLSLSDLFRFLVDRENKSKEVENDKGY